MKPMTFIAAFPFIVVITAGVWAAVFGHECYSDAGRRMGARSSLKSLCAHVVEFQIDCPTASPFNDLQELIQSARPCSTGPYLRPSMLKDPWDQPFLLEQGDLGIVLISTGPDRVARTTDDVRVDCSNMDGGVRD